MIVDPEVAIVGFGPVGATLAILLAQMGRSVSVLERWQDPYPLPRAVHLDDQASRILQACGLGGLLPAITEPAGVHEWRDGAGVTLLRLGSDALGLSGWPQSSMFYQPTLEAMLHRRARDAGVDIRRGLDVSAFAHDSDNVLLKCSNTITVRAKYVVGCDGASSAVRELAGLPLRDLGFSYDWLIVDVILKEPRAFEPINLHICDPARPVTAVSGGPGRRRWEFMRLPDDDPDDMNSPRRAWELLQPWGVNPENATLERHSVYTFKSRCAETWRVGRILLAGDAAHQLPPFAGQGMCTGIRDAANLAWKLDHVLTGCAPEDLLDLYGIERRPDVLATIDFSMELGKLMAGSDRREQTDVMGLPPPIGGFIDRASPHSGHLFPQGLLEGHLFDDVHGAGWRLVTVEGARDLGRDASSWFASFSGRTVTVPSDDPVYGPWFADHGCAFALQRPDFHLFGTAADSSAATALLEGLRDRLAADPR